MASCRPPRHHPQILMANYEENIMTHDILSYMILLGFVILCSFLIDCKNSTKFWYVLLLFSIIGFVDNLFNTITIAYPETQLIKSNTWNNYL